MRWRKVRRVFAPKEWFDASIRKEKRLMYDYAVLELRRNHKRPYMTPVVFHVKSQGSKLQFNGFPGDKKKNTMWQVQCPLIHYRDFMLSHCDTTRGMSGSGSYLLLNKKSYVVRGLAVASVQYRNHRRLHRYNVVNPLTREKIKNICVKWMKAGRDCRSFKWYLARQHNTQTGI
jgi:V8-like Glu-specific endopeptidase